ncbi:MAG: hypothetical protein JXB32_19475 [Deltaproteobacteria bacterium]|nr:hypothetical protein [Deltaproteobacteria bacterium]
MRNSAWLAAALCVLAFAGAARANPMDLTLSRLYDERACTDTRNQSLCADQAAFRELAREFGLVMAPALLAPAETLGYAGFYLGLEGSITTINSSSSEPSNVWFRGTEDQNPDKVMFVPSIHARKGLPFSFELGTSVSYVSATEQVLLGVDIRWAILEGYRTGWKAYFPDIAVRGAVNRLMGDDEMDMTVWSVDVALSHPFSISGMMTITPFLGYQFVQTIADTALVANGMIDPDDAPHTLIECSGDPDYQTSCVGGIYGPNIRYLDFDREYIDRHRGFAGVRLMYEHLAMILQGAFTDGQQSFGVSIGMDY